MPFEIQLVGGRYRTCDTLEEMKQEILLRYANDPTALERVVEYTDDGTITGVYGVMLDVELVPRKFDHRTRPREKK